MIGCVEILRVPYVIDSCNTPQHQRDQIGVTRFLFDEIVCGMGVEESFEPEIPSLTSH